MAFNQEDEVLIIVLRQEQGSGLWREEVCLNLQTELLCVVFEQAAKEDRSYHNEAAVLENYIFSDII